MKNLFEYINIHKSLSKVHAKDDNIYVIVKDALDRLGHDADLNFIDVSEVTKMESLFSCCTNDSLGPEYKDLNPNISRWNVSNVTTMYSLFYGCRKFNCDISEWDVSNVEYTHYMFWGCWEFNQDISDWDVHNVKDMTGMFCECKEFNCNLSNWNVDKCKFWSRMFDGCPIKWKPKFK